MRPRLLCALDRSAGIGTAGGRLSTIWWSIGAHGDSIRSSGWRAAGTARPATPLVPTAYWTIPTRPW